MVTLCFLIYEQFRAEWHSIYRGNEVLSSVMENVLKQLEFLTQKINSIDGLYF